MWCMHGETHNTHLSGTTVTLNKWFFMTPEICSRKSLLSRWILFMVECCMKDGVFGSSRNILRNKWMYFIKRNKSSFTLCRICALFFWFYIREISSTLCSKPEIISLLLCKMVFIPGLNGWLPSSIPTKLNCPDLFCGSFFVCEDRLYMETFIYILFFVLLWITLRELPGM